jgi:hypothetical protein
MATARPNEEQEKVREVDHAELLRLLTVQRFKVRKPPATVADRATPGDHQWSEAALVSSVGDANVRGQVHDAKNSNQLGRTR